MGIEERIARLEKVVKALTARLEPRLLKLFADPPPPAEATPPPPPPQCVSVCGSSLVGIGEGQQRKGP